MIITIITPVLNGALAIAATLESVQDQLGVQIEHIIVDGGSTDHTLRIIEHFPSVSQVVTGADRGIYEGINKGLALAIGDIVGILNAGDIYEHERVLSEVLLAFKQSPSTSAVYGDLVVVNPLDTQRVLRYWKSGHASASSFLLGWSMPHPSLFVHRKAYEQHGFYDVDYRISGDYAFMLRLFYKAKLPFVYVPQLWVRMPAGGKSNANLKSRLRAHAEDWKAWWQQGAWWFPFTPLLKPLRKIGQFF